MRDYSKVSPQFWIGKTGKALRRKGVEAVLVGAYLMTAPSANMLGLYYLPLVTIAHETGLGMEGASKGLQWACESGFCAYDEDAEVVWVYEMAQYQIAAQLKAEDKRCIGIQSDYDNQPESKHLSGFYDKYQGAFHLKKRRETAGEIEAPSKPLRSQEQEQEQEQDKKSSPNPAEAGPAARPEKSRATAIALQTFIGQCKERGERPLRDYAPLWAYAESAGIDSDHVALAWAEFCRRFLPGGAQQEKRQKDWRCTFRKYVENNYFKLWAIDKDGKYFLTSQGKQAAKFQESKEAA